MVHLGLSARGQQLAAVKGAINMTHGVCYQCVGAAVSLAVLHQFWGKHGGNAMSIKQLLETLVSRDS